MRTDGTPGYEFHGKGKGVQATAVSAAQAVERSNKTAADQPFAHFNNLVDRTRFPNSLDQGSNADDQYGSVCPIPPNEISSKLTISPS